MTNRSILSAMAGITDGTFAYKCITEGGAIKACIGGYPLGKEMYEASIKIKRRGRSEFVIHPLKINKYIQEQLRHFSNPNQCIINVRTIDHVSIKRLVTFLSSLDSQRPIIEINLHCRQAEVTEIGGGQALIDRISVLSNIINNVKRNDFSVSLKIRGNVITDINSWVKKINTMEVDYLHIDAYQTGKQGIDINLIEKFSEIFKAKIIANNSIRTVEVAKEVLSTGVSFFSVARGAINNPEIFRVFDSI